MKTLPRDEANVIWDTLWSDMKSEWFKVFDINKQNGLTDLKGSSGGVLRIKLELI